LTNRKRMVYLLAMNLKNMLTIRQAADEVGVSRQTVYEWIRSGFLGVTDLGFGHKMVNVDALHAAAKAKAERNIRGNFLRRCELKEKNKKTSLSP